MSSPKPARPSGHGLTLAPEGGNTALRLVQTELARRKWDEATLLKRCKEDDDDVGVDIETAE